MGEWYNTATAMLAYCAGGAPYRLEHELETELRELNELCRHGGGELVSRQMIAMAILDWRRRTHGRSGIEYL